MSSFHISSLLFDHHLAYPQTSTTTTTTSCNTVIIAFKVQTHWLPTKVSFTEDARLSENCASIYWENSCQGQGCRKIRWLWQDQGEIWRYSRFTNKNKNLALFQKNVYFFCTGSKNLKYLFAITQQNLLLIVE